MFFFVEPSTEIEQQEQLDQVNNMINRNNSAAAAAGENNNGAAADDDVQDSVSPTATAPATPVLSPPPPPPLLNNEPIEHNNNIQQQVIASAKTNGQLVDGDGSRNKVNGLWRHSVDQKKIGQDRTFFLFFFKYGSFLMANGFLGSLGRLKNATKTVLFIEGR